MEAHPSCHLEWTMPDTLLGVIRTDCNVNTCSSFLRFVICLLLAFTFGSFVNWQVVLLQGAKHYVFQAPECQCKVGLPFPFQSQSWLQEHIGDVSLALLSQPRMALKAGRRSHFKQAFWHLKNLMCPPPRTLLLAPLMSLGWEMKSSHINFLRVQFQRGLVYCNKHKKGALRHLNEL